MEVFAKPTPEQSAVTETASTQEILAGLAHPGLSAELLRLMAHHASPRVRERVARHPRTPAESVKVLLRDEDWKVRLSAAQHPNLPMKALLLAATDAQDEMRFALAANPRLPVTLLVVLSNDKNGVIAAKADETLTHLFD